MGDDYDPFAAARAVIAEHTEDANGCCALAGCGRIFVDGIDAEDGKTPARYCDSAEVALARLNLRYKPRALSEGLSRF